MRVKICGITQPEQGKAITQLGATTLGFICVPASPRYIEANKIAEIVQPLSPTTETIGVFVNASLNEIEETVQTAHLSGVQLHGDESPEFCQHLRQRLPQTELIKALRIQSAESLSVAQNYTSVVNTLLLDAYHPHLLGGTGQTIAWEMLQNFNPDCPWLLAGGLTPENVVTALEKIHPNGIDLSSGVERSPGNKDLAKVAQLFQAIAQI